MLLSLDVGRKIIGVARTDLDERFVFPIGSFLRAQNRALTAILALIAKEKPRGLVVGLPLDAKGHETQQALNVRQFCSRLQKRSPIKIIFTDESYSTEDALELLNLTSTESHQAAKKSGELDAAAAGVILKSYIDSLAKRQIS